MSGHLSPPKSSTRRPLIGVLAGLSLAAMLILGLLAPGRAVATADIQICFAIDASGSISDDEFTTEKEGFAAAIEDNTIIAHDGTIEISALVFSETTVKVVTPTTIDSPATATSVADDIRNADRPVDEDLTNPAAAIDACAQNIFGSAKFASSQFQAINMATNGQATIGGDPVDARIDAVNNKGIDRLDVVAVQSANLTTLLDMVYPQPPEKVDFPDTPSGDTGFVLNVDDFDDFEAALAIKVPAIIPTPPVVGGVSIDPVLEDGPSRSGVSWLLLALAGTALAALTLTGVLFARSKQQRR